MTIGVLLLSLISLITGNDSAGSEPRAEILFVGDAMQHQAQLDKAKEIGKDKYDYSDCFTLISPEIMESDFAVCNLEVPLGGGTDYSGYPCFSAPDAYAESLRDAGFGLMLTANNHCLDRRDKGARRTLLALDSLGILHTGTFANPAARTHEVPMILDVNGFKIALLNYTYGTNGIMPQTDFDVALIDKNKIKKEIELAKGNGAEIIAVAMHWGIEYVLLENGVQRDLADFLIECGADLIIGGHPHVIQPMKIVRNERENKDVFIVYSLGNFISNMNTADTRGGALARVTLSRDDSGKAILQNADYDLFFSAKPEDGKNFMVIPSWREDQISAAQMPKWKLFERGARKIFDQHNINVESRH